MSAATRFHTDQARLQISKESWQLTSRYLFPQYHMTVFIYTVNLENLLSQI